MKDLACIPIVLLLLENHSIQNFILVNAISLQLIASHIATKLFCHS